MFSSVTLGWQGGVPKEVWGVGVGILILIIVMFLFIAAVVAVSLYFVFKVVTRMQHNQALLTTGVPAQATILKTWDTGVTLNDNPQVGLLLEVRPRDGRPAYQVETKSVVSRLKIPQVQTGAAIAVKVDPNDPARIALDLV